MRRLEQGMRKALFSRGGPEKDLQGGELQKETQMTQRVLAMRRTGVRMFQKGNGCFKYKGARRE